MMNFDPNAAPYNPRAVSARGLRWMLDIPETELCDTTENELNSLKPFYNMLYDVF